MRGRDLRLSRHAGIVAVTVRRACQHWPTDKLSDFWEVHVSTVR
jgi:hypothetical protein